jgi:predicted  nucleic acid-binding Zn-ribbon protein
MVEELRSGLARALEALADVTREQKPSKLECDVAELRERVEYLEDSLAAFEVRAERDDAELRPWNEVRR